MIIKDYGQVIATHPYGCLITDTAVVDPIIRNVLPRQIAAGGWITSNIYRANLGIWIRNGSLEHNLYTNVGRDFWHSQIYMATTGARAANFMALSEDTTAPTVSDTTLAGEITTGGLQRADVTTASPGITHTTGTNSTLFDITFTATSSFSAVQKVAIFNNSSGGIMAHAGTIVPGALNPTDGIQIQYTLNLG